MTSFNMPKIIRRGTHRSEHAEAMKTKGLLGFLTVSNCVTRYPTAETAYQGSSLFTARRVIRVESVLDARAKLTFAQKFIEKLGLGDSFRVSAAGGDDSSTIVDIEAKDAVPVAFAPALRRSGRVGLGVAGVHG